MSRGIAALRSPHSPPEVSGLPLVSLIHPKLFAGSGKLSSARNEAKFLPRTHGAGSLIDVRFMVKLAPSRVNAFT